MVQSLTENMESYRESIETTRSQLEFLLKLEKGGGQEEAVAIPDGDKEEWSPSEHRPKTHAPVFAPRVKDGAAVSKATSNVAETDSDSDLDPGSCPRDTAGAECKCCCTDTALDGQGEGDGDSVDFQKYRKMLSQV